MLKFLDEEDNKLPKLTDEQIDNMVKAIEMVDTDAIDEELAKERVEEAKQQGWSFK